MERKDTGSFRVLGLMSGTSLDGLDMALCNFVYASENWSYSVEKADTICYDQEMKNLLKSAPGNNAEAITKLDHYYGKWIAKQCNEFLKNSLAPILIASHGHTVFHRPEQSCCLQIGNGNDIAALTGLPVVYDFRSMDIALGGQGAPLVPAGDELLFGNYDSCLNLGGFSNISYRKNNKRIAFDICPVNIALNEISARLNLEYDKDGENGRKGNILPDILKKLNNLEFYKLSPPRSLGREWVDKFFMKEIDTTANSTDLLRTIHEHIAHLISEIINREQFSTVLITGGGAKNIFLIELLRKKCKAEIVLPDTTTIDFKEALVFAFLGLLRYRNEINCYSSVTGAKSDSVSGVLAEPFQNYPGR